MKLPIHKFRHYGCAFIDSHLARRLLTTEYHHYIYVYDAQLRELLLAM